MPLQNTPNNDGAPLEATPNGNGNRGNRSSRVLNNRLEEGHDQIPQLYAYFQEDGQFYLVQEWIQGLTLTQKVEQVGPQPEAVVQEILSQLLPVVSYLHSRQMVHRDIKPDNIILRFWQLITSFSRTI